MKGASLVLTMIAMEIARYKAGMCQTIIIVSTCVAIRTHCPRMRSLVFRPELLELWYA